MTSSTAQWLAALESNSTVWPCGSAVDVRETIYDHWTRCGACRACADTETEGETPSFPIVVRKLYETLLYYVNRHQANSKECISAYGTRLHDFPGEDILVKPVSPLLARELAIQFAGFQLSYSLLERPSDAVGWEHEENQTEIDVPRGVWWYLGWFGAELPVFQPPYSVEKGMSATLLVPYKISLPHPGSSICHGIDWVKYLVERVVEWIPTSIPCQYAHSDPSRQNIEEYFVKYLLQHHKATRKEITRQMEHRFQDHVPSLRITIGKDRHWTVDWAPLTAESEDDVMLSF